MHSLKKILKTNFLDSGYYFKSRLLLIKFLIYASIAILAVDLVYKTVNGISYQNREACILYNVLPKLVFLFYEYFIELTLIVIVGIFIAVVLEQKFARYRKYYPKNQFSAFLYASVIPVCACSAIPLLQTMQEKIKIRTLITFVVAAPLLNPFIITLSFSVLGIKYGILRIAGSAFLAIVSGHVVSVFYKNEKLNYLMINTCHPKSCHNIKPTVFEETFNILVKVLPYILLAGFLGLLFEFYNPARFLQKIYVGNKIVGVPFALLLGMPIYFCNGADIVFLQPIIDYAGLSLGTALTFSLTSTSICVSSFIMLLKFLGKKLTMILTLSILLITMLLGVFINLVI